jgi:hypothetical protein
MKSVNKMEAYTKMFGEEKVQNMIPYMQAVG